MSNDIKALHDLTEELLLAWLDYPPDANDRRALKALELFAESFRCLHVVCINLGVIDID